MSDDILDTPAVEPTEEAVEETANEEEIATENEAVAEEETATEEVAE